LNFPIILHARFAGVAVACVLLLVCRR